MAHRWPFVLVVLLGAPYASAQCDVGATDGQEAGTWDEPITLGATTEWHPHDVGDADLAAALDSLTMTLSWTNGPDALGGADFGIAVGTPDGFYFWNPQYQAGLGDQEETLTLDRDDLERAGWTGEDLRIGPSISTGGGSAAGIDYSLVWEVALDPDVCGDDDAVPADPDGDPTTTAGDNTPFQWWIGAAIVLAGVAGLIVYSTRK